MTTSAEDRIVLGRREQLLELPVFTLIRVGLRTPSGPVQGGIRYRILDGLGPFGRDEHPVDVLHREVTFWVTGHDWPWGFDVLAVPV